MTILTTSAGIASFVSCLHSISRRTFEEMYLVRCEIHIDPLPYKVAGAVRGASDDPSLGCREKPELFMPKVFDTLDSAYDGRPLARTNLPIYQSTN